PPDHHRLGAGDDRRCQARGRHGGPGRRQRRGRRRRPGRRQAGGGGRCHRAGAGAGARGLRMPAWQTVLIVAALVAAAFVLVVAWGRWRDPSALVRAECARERMASGLARREVGVDGIRWVYAEGMAAADNAPVLVLLHGYTGSKENWYPVARRLRGRYRLLVPDLPGWGESQRDGVAGHGF